MISGRGRGRGIIARMSNLNVSDSDSESSEASASEPSEISRDSTGSQSEATGSSGSQPGSSRPARGPSGRGRLKKTLMRPHGHQFDSDSDSSSDTQATSGTQDSYDVESQATRPSTEAPSREGSEAASETSSTRETSPVPSTKSETSTIQPFPKGKGNSGETIKLVGNYLKITYTSEKRVQLYTVKFEPPIDSIRLRREILRKSEDIARVIGPTFIFTGMNLFLPKLLDNTLCADLKHPNDESIPVSITIEHTKTPSDDELVTFYNNIFNHVMHELHLVQIKRHHYDPVSKITIPAHKLELWPGHVCAIQDFDGGLMLTCDTSHRVLRTNTARDLLFEVYKSDPENFERNAKARLVGAIVLTRYNNKTYKIDDIDFKRNPTYEFTDSSGRSQTYKEYFQRHWQLEIKDLKQPLLMNRMKLLPGQTDAKVIDLIPEFCYLTGLTDDMRKDNKVMKDLAAHTRLSPEIRLSKLRDFINRVNTTPSARQILDNWGLSIQHDPISLDGRKLPSETLRFGASDRGGDAAKVPVPPTAMWRNDAVRQRMQYAPDLDRWMFYFHKADVSKAGEFSRMLIDVASKLGFKIGQPKTQVLDNENPSTYVNAIKTQTPRSCQMVVVMTPRSSQREDRYAAIKKLCLVELALPNQCLRASTLQGDKMRSVCQNIALQMAVKLGGRIWSVHIPLKDTMLIGLDSYHDPGNRNNSVLAVVASMNSSYNDWFTQCHFQSKGEEIVNVYNSVITVVLKKYREANGRIPSKIFIYRDGVGDGDLNALMNYEVPQIEQSLDHYVAETNLEKPTVTFTVVQKRVNTKVFCRNRGRFENPPAGTVIDSTIIRKQLNSFYLISQHVTQGTVTPTHYILLHNTSESITVDHMQKLTYKLTHLYYNFPATIRVPAMCQYAHKAAYLMGQFVGRDANDGLRDKLYYL